MHTIVWEDGTESHFSGHKTIKRKNEIYKRICQNRKSIKASPLSHLISPQLICYHFCLLVEYVIRWMMESDYMIMCMKLKRKMCYFRAIKLCLSIARHLELSSDFVWSKHKTVELVFIKRITDKYCFKQVLTRFLLTYN